MRFNNLKLHSKPKYVCPLLFKGIPVYWACFKFNLEKSWILTNEADAHSLVNLLVQPDRILITGEESSNIVSVFTWTLTYGFGYEIASFSEEAAYGGGDCHVRLTCMEFLFLCDFRTTSFGTKPKIKQNGLFHHWFCLILDSYVIQLGLIDSFLLDAWNTKECTK